MPRKSPIAPQDIRGAAPKLRQTLRAKIFAIVWSALVALILALYAVSSTILMNGFEELETEFAGRNIERIRNTLAAEGESLQGKVADWATWDDTYEFMENPTEEYLRSNVGAFTAFYDLDVNFIVYVHPTGRIVFKQGYSRETNAEIPVSDSLLTALRETPGLLNHTGPESSRQGILRLPEGLLLVASRPITRTDRSGPIRGTLIFARFVDGRQIARLADLTRVRVSIHGGDDPGLPPDMAQAVRTLSAASPVSVRPVDETSLAAYSMYTDIAGRPNLILRVTMGRSIHAQGLATRRYLVLSLIVGGVAIAGLAIVLLDRLVLSRLAKVVADVSAVGAGGNISARVAVDGDDELSALAFTINSTLDVLEKSQEQLRSSDRRLALVLEATTEGVWDWNVQTGHCTFSPQWISTLGYRPDEIPPCLESWQALVHPDDMPAVDHALREHLEGRTAHYECEHRLREKSGRWRWHQNRGRIVERDAAGKPLRMVGTDRDISDRRRLEQQFHQAQKMEAVGKLAGGIAHDFNNLLTIVIGHSDLLLASMEESSEEGESAREIHAAAEKAAGLTRQLLAFSRSQALQMQVLDLREVVEKMEDMLCRLIGEDIVLETMGQATQAGVRADRSQIEQLLMNMALNARDAMPGGGRLIIEVSEAQVGDATGIPRGGYVILSVIDSGHGMTEQVRSRIFEPFFTTKPQGRGSGLGLATCYGIVNRSNGHIAVESEPGRGTTFRIYLPLAGSVDEIPEDVRLPGALVGGSETILLVEDEPGVRKLGAGILRSLGYIVFEAVDGKDAQRVIGEHGADNIDLVLTDVVMPNMGGKELADWIAGVRPDLPVLFCSGYTSDAFARQGMVDEPVTMLEKPFTPGALARKVREVIDEHAPARA